MKKFIPILVLIAISCNQPEDQNNEHDKQGIFLSEGQEPIPSDMYDSVQWNSWPKKGGTTSGVACLKPYNFRILRNQIISYVCATSNVQYYVQPHLTGNEDPNNMLQNVPGYATIRVQNTGYTQIKIKFNGGAWSNAINRAQYIDYNVTLIDPPDCNMTTLAQLATFFTVEVKNTGCLPGATEFKYNTWIQSMTSTPNTGNGSNSISSQSTSWFISSNWSPASNCTQCVLPN